MSKGSRRAMGVIVPEAVEREVGGIKAWLRAEADEVERNTCQACGDRIRVMVFRGTGFCSQLCENAGPA